MIDFSKITSLTIGGTIVVKLSVDGRQVWTAEEPEPRLDWCKFTAVQAGSTIQRGWEAWGGGTLPTVNLEYSTDGANWSEWADQQTLTLENVGDYILVRGDNDCVSKNEGCSLNFKGTGLIDGSGQIMSLLSKDLSKTAITQNNDMADLFCNFTPLRKAPDIKITAWPSGGNAFHNMFTNCTNLTYLKVIAPRQPNTGAYYNWLYNTAGGTLAASQAFADGAVRGDRYVPTNWAIEIVES